MNIDELMATNKDDLTKLINCFEEYKDNLKLMCPQLYYALLAIKDDCKGKLK